MKYFQRLKSKISGRPEGAFPPSDDANLSSPPADSANPASPPADTASQAKTEETLGLFQVVDIPVTNSESHAFPVDIIAIHGLNGGAYTTWTYDKAGCMWIRDLLPQSLPGCRVFTYGYPSHILSTSTARVQECARDLLVCVRDMQESALNTRPIIFVCHSLGGIVFKQALVTAHADSRTYGGVLSSVRGVLFLGTPHRGSSSAGVAHTVATVINTLTTSASLGAAPKPLQQSMVAKLVYNSRDLQDLTDAAKNRLANISVVSCYEQNPVPGLRVLIVDPGSATLALPNEEAIPMYEDHRSICRFSKETQSYKKVANALRRLARQASGEVPVATDQSSTHSSTILLSDIERNCMTTLGSHDGAKPLENPPTPARGTCLWIRTHSIFLSWKDSHQDSLLLLTGHTGSGKSTLSWSIAQFFAAGRGRSRNVITHMCQNSHQQTDGRTILISFILQIVDRHRSLLRYVRPVYERSGPSMVESFALLWRVFRMIIRDPKVGSLFVILDALDECEGVSGKTLLQSILDFLVESNQSGVVVPRVKFLVTSRPSLLESFNHTERILISRISIDDSPAGYAEDVQLFIQERVEKMAMHRRHSEEVKDFLFESMASRADQTFLWSHLVLETIERSPVSNRKAFQRILADIPKGLAAIYSRYLSAIAPDHHEEALKLLELLLASMRPLRLDELNVAFTIDESHTESLDVIRDGETAMDQTVHGILGPLVRISTHLESSDIGVVRLVHQSLKDFLLKPVPAMDSSVAPDLRTAGRNSNLRITTACLQYLFLREFEVDLFAPGVPTEAAQMQELPQSPPMVEGGFWDNNQPLDSDFFFREPDVLLQGVCESLDRSYRFFDYASLHWMVHLAACEAEAPTNVVIKASQLLDGTTLRRRNWLQYYHTRASFQFDDALVERDPVVLAAQFNLPRVMKYLIGVHPPSPSSLDQSLYWASRLGHDKVVAALLVVGADPNFAFLMDQTCLAVASEHGHMRCVVQLLGDKRVNVDMPGRRGRTALSFSCAAGYDMISSLLLEDCNPGIPDVTGATPLFWATRGGHTSAVVTLARKQGVDTNHQDKQGRTALSWAAGDGVTDSLKALLVLPGVDVNLKDYKGMSPLVWAARNGHADVVGTLLMASSIDHLTLDHDERGAISWACGNGHHEVLVKLLSKGYPGKDLEDIDGWPPLTWAVQSDAPDIIHALAQADVVIDHRDRNGKTALFWAVEYGHARVVQALLQSGSNPRIECGNGHTPLSLAEGLQRGDLLKLMT